jgi:hypothetical protein
LVHEGVEKEKNHDPRGVKSEKVAVIRPGVSGRVGSSVASDVALYCTAPESGERSVSLDHIVNYRGAIYGLVARYVIAFLAAPFGLLSVAILCPNEMGDFKRRHLFIPVMIIVNIWNTYVITAWCAFCSLVKFGYINYHGIGFQLFHYVIGFIACVGPLASMAAYEEKDSFATNLGLVVSVNSSSVTPTLGFGTPCL